MTHHPFLCAAAAAIVALGCGESDPEVPFARVSRETVVSTVQTNGKVEPLTAVSVRAEREGTATAIRVRNSQSVRKGELLVELEAAPDRAALAAAEARVSEVQALLDLFARGGGPADRVAIDNDLISERIELEAARKEAAILERLVAKQAAPRVELDGALARVRRSEERLAALGRKRDALVSEADRRSAEARLAAARAEVDQARRRIELARIRSPIDGIVYGVVIRPGAYLRPGDMVAEVGRLDRLRTLIYVDEPELGRVGTGMPVRITWDARPGREWQGTVEQTPAEVVALGTRQVGEVTGVIGNPGLDLLPGANINAEIHAGASENALTIPKEALRRQSGEVGVYVLNGNQVHWRPVAVGLSSVTRVEIVSGLAEDDAVALVASELSDGMTVRPRFP